MRYEVLVVGVDDFVGGLEAAIRGMAGQAVIGAAGGYKQGNTKIVQKNSTINGIIDNKMNNIIDNGIQSHDDNDDSQLKPLRKINPVFYSYKNIIHVSGNGPVHGWQITSPLWAYSPHMQTWKQFNYEQPDGTKQWIFNLQQYLIVISSNKIQARKYKYNNQEYESVTLVASPSKEIVRPQSDSYLYSYYTNHRHHACLMLLVKTSTHQRQPMLLEFTAVNVLNNVPMYDSKSNRGTSKSNIINNTNINTNINTNDMSNITVVRYDLGVFLNSTSTHIYDNYNTTNSNTSISTSKITYNTNTNSTNNNNNTRLWHIINQIAYMQVTQTNTSTSTLGFTSSANNFIKKSQSANHSKKTTFVINLYTKTIKNNNNSWPNTSPTIQLLNYSIKLSILQPIQFNASNVQLYRYFQAKEYCDLLFVAEKRQVQCNKQLFQFYSPKFKKFYINSNSNSNSNTVNSKNNQNNVFVRLDHTKLETVYFLVQLLYHGFADIHDIDQTTLIDLMILAHKFQITQLQALCQQQINFSVDNFQKLYDYFRNSETSIFREKLLKFFVINAQQIIKIMPIGKVEEIIRLVYSPECAHNNFSQIKAKLQSTYSIKDPEGGETRQINKCINYAGIIKSQQIGLKICMKCSKLLGYNHESHRKNKSSVRGSSLGSFGHRKKQNNSN